ARLLILESPAQRVEAATLCGWPTRHRPQGCGWLAGSSGISLLRNRRNRRKKCGAFMFIAGHPHIAAVNLRDAFCHGKTNSRTRCAIRIVGRPIVAVEDAFAVRDGNDRPM